MLNSVAAIVIFAGPVSVDASSLEEFLQKLAPDEPVSVRQSPEGLDVQSAGTSALISFVKGPMPDEDAVASIGMADLSEADAAHLLTHKAHARIQTGGDGPVMERMILLIRCGMALCDVGGWALCVPSSGLCIRGERLKKILALDAKGPRVWGLDEADENVPPGYEATNLWNSLRQNAQPSELLVGFVPALVENQTWFFSAGHSLFDLPEIAFSDGSIEEFAAIRELFGYLFPYFYKRPDKLRPGSSVKTAGDEMTISFHALPERFDHLQATTGTLRLRMLTTSGMDDEWS